MYGSYKQWSVSITLKKNPTSITKANTLKQLKVLKDIEFIDNKLYYYIKPTDSPAPRAVYSLGVLGHFCPLGYFELGGIKTFLTWKYWVILDSILSFHMSNCSNVSQYIYIIHKKN